MSRVPPPKIHRAVALAIGAAVLAAGLAGVTLLVAYLPLFAARLPFPLDVEWMEGGMLLHAQRIAEGKQIYVAPSVEFIPFLYTPLYPALLAALSFVLPFGYALGRAVSVACFAGALAVVVTMAAREGWEAGRRARTAAIALGVAAAAAIVGSFEFTAGFYDLVRSDSLLLVLEGMAVLLAVRGRTWKSAAIAGVVIALGFFAKQTASIIGIGLGLGLLVASWRRGIVYGLFAAVTLALGLGYLVWSSEGWFWTYIFKLHQSHEFRWGAAVEHAPKVLWKHEGALLVALVLVTIGLALPRKLRRTDAILWAVAVAGILAACIGFGTQWAAENAYIPAVYFPTLALAVLGARLALHAANTAAPAAVVLALVAPVVLIVHDLGLRAPNLAKLAPNAQDRAAARQFLSILARHKGDGFIPFHPYYNVLLGRRPHVHRMGIMDVGGSLGRPAGLDEALGARKFGFVVLDWKSYIYEFPHVDSIYKQVHEFRDGVDAVRSFSGAETSPRYLLVPNEDPPPPPEGAIRVADFEMTNWGAWRPEGEAFGPLPAWAPPGFYGRYAAHSGRSGPAPQGALRSPAFRLDKPRLRFRLGGPADPNLRVLLLAGSETVHAVSPGGAPTDVEWDVRALAGREAVFVVEDRSPSGAITVDQILAH